MTVAELAKAAEFDNDEALIHLWEAGLDRYKDPKDRLRRRDLDTAFRAVGLPTTRDLTVPDYWKERLGLDSDAFRELLVSLGTPMAKDARTLPKGAIAKLKRRVAGGIETSPEGLGRPREEEWIEEPFEWQIIGHRRSLRFLTEEEVEGIHWETRLRVGDPPRNPAEAVHHAL